MTSPLGLAPGSTPAVQPVDEPRRPTSKVSGGDRVFTSISTVAASVSLVVVGLTLVFLIKEALPALRVAGLWNFLTSSTWTPKAGKFGVGGLIIGTLLIAIVALVIAVPLAIGMALFINEYSPRWLRPILTSAVDLLAALPSLVFGMWGLFALQGQAQPIARFLADHGSAIPLFQLSRADSVLVGSAFIAGLIVGVMVIPIITSVSRDVMAQVPRELCEAALGLGGSRWGMIKSVILPFGRSGIVGATLLGFGRALGETIGVALIISFQYKANWHVLERGTGSIASFIVIKFGEAVGNERSGLVAAGLALFVLTFSVNFFARRIVSRTAMAK